MLLLDGPSNRRLYPDGLPKCTCVGYLIGKSTSRKVPKMTDTHQVESTKPPKRKRERARKQSDQTHQPAQIDFDEAIPPGQKLVAKLKSQHKAVESTEMKLGELAHRLKPVYGEETVAVFANKIGIPAATLKRYRSAY